jgi:hypothetical protein
MSQDMMALPWRYRDLSDQIKPGDVFGLDGRIVVVQAMPDGVTTCRDDRGRVAVRNAQTGRLSYVRAGRLLLCRPEPAASAPDLDAIRREAFEAGYQAGAGDELHDRQADRHLIQGPSMRYAAWQAQRRGETP